MQLETVVAELEKDPETYDPANYVVVCSAIPATASHGAGGSKAITSRLISPTRRAGATATTTA
jgi:hypothetical protein